MHILCVYIYIYTYLSLSIYIYRDIHMKVVFFLLGALTIVEIMDAHKGPRLEVICCTVSYM